MHYNLHTTGNLGYQFGSLWTTPWPDEKDLFLKLFIRNNRKFPYEILTFFLGKLYQKYFLHYNLHTTGSLGYQFGSLWTTPWPDEKDLFLKFVICEIRKFSYEILTFFLGKLYKKFFLHYNLHTTGSLGYQFGSLWATPWPDEKDLFLKFVICEIRKFPYEILTFFLGKLYQKFFLHYNLHTTDSLGYQFGSLWTTPWPDEKDLFLKFVNCEIRKFPYEILTFFLGKLYKKFFLHYNLHTTGSLGYQFGSLWTTPWPDEKDLFLKFVICEIRKFPYEILTFFLGKLYQKFFLHYNLHTTGSLGYQFGSLWTTPWPDEKDLFLKFVICEIRKFPYEILTFFLGKLYKKFFLHYNLHTTGSLGYQFGSLWTTPWPDEKDLFLKFVICEIRKFPYEILTFFLGKLYQKFFLHYNLHTTDSLGYQFGSLWTTPWPDEKDLFLKFVICEIRKFPYEILTFFLGKLYKKFFLHYNLHTTGSLGYQFGSLWTTPWPDEKDLFLKFVICEIRKFPYEILTFFLGKLYKKFF